MRSRSASAMSPLSQHTSARACHILIVTNMPRIVTARPPKRVRYVGWPRIRQVIVGRDPVPPSALELQQAAERVVARRPCQPNRSVRYDSCSKDPYGRLSRGGFFVTISDRAPKPWRGGDASAHMPRWR
jgi:hypothetical protein